MYSSLRMIMKRKTDISILYQNFESHYMKSNKMVGSRVKWIFSAVHKMNTFKCKMDTIKCEKVNNKHPLVEEDIFKKNIVNCTPLYSYSTSVQFGSLMQYFEDFQSKNYCKSAMSKGRGS